jgi:hypothetical protein
MDDWTVPSDGGGEGSNASGFARLFGVSPATLPPETERLPETIGEAGSIELVDERWLSAGDGGIGFAAGDGGSGLVSIIARPCAGHNLASKFRVSAGGFAAEVSRSRVLIDVKIHGQWRHAEHTCGSDTRDRTAASSETLAEMAI